MDTPAKLSILILSLLLYHSQTLRSVEHKHFSKAQHKEETIFDPTVLYWLIIMRVITVFAGDFAQ